MKKLIDKLFNKKGNEIIKHEIIKQCDGILDNIRSIQDIISDNQRYIANMQNGVQELMEINEEMKQINKEYSNSYYENADLNEMILLEIENLKRLNAVGDKE